MSAKFLLIFVLLGMVLFLALSSRQVVCNPPYIFIGTDCCLDQNNNSICDRDEYISSTAAMTTTTVDVCSALTGSERDKCLEERSRQGFLQKCLDRCDSISLGCREICRGKWLPSEKDDCTSRCFSDYRSCTLDCQL